MLTDSLLTRTRTGRWAVPPVDLACLGVLAGGVVAFVVGMAATWLWLAVVGCALVVVSSLGTALAHLHDLAFAAAFHLAFLVFLLGRWLATLGSDRLHSEFPLGVTRRTLLVVFLAAVVVSVVQQAYLRLRGRRPLGPAEPPPAYWPRHRVLRLLALAAVGLTALMRVVENVLLARQAWENGYATQYQAVPVVLPTLLHLVSLAYDIAFTIVLAWRPPRRVLAGLLALQALVLATSMLSGQRMYAVVWVAVLAALLPVLGPPQLREALRRRAIPAAAAAGALLVVAIAGLTVVQHVRNGSDSGNFLESEGVSYVVIGYAEEFRDRLPTTNDSYTFGRLVDTVTGAPAYPPASGVEARRGNNLGATVSWLTQRRAYRAGAGFGTTYVAELDVDYGPIGVAVFSVLLGAALVLLGPLARRGWVATVLVVFLARSLVIMPRDFAMNWVFPFLSFSVLGPLVFVVALTWVLDRRSPPRVE